MAFLLMRLALGGAIGVPDTLLRSLQR